MRMKPIIALSAISLFTVAAIAQSTTTDPKTGAGPNAPTDAQCNSGHTADTKLTKAEFDAACAKMREKKEKTQ